MPLIGNDDGKKMIEREDAWLFLSEYAHVTGIDMALIAIGERPDFTCENDGQRYGLELVKAMRNPVSARIEKLFGGDGQLDPLDALMVIQERVYEKEQKRASAG